MDKLVREREKEVEENNDVKKKNRRKAENKGKNRR
jgi:hypothetical protein